MPQSPKRAYSFKEGLAMMAAKDVDIDPYLAADAGDDARTILAALRRAKTAKGTEKAKHIAAAQTELRKLNPQQHGKLISALQVKVLALQGRGGDTAVAHLEPGEMVIPRRVLTSELARLIAAEAAKRGIDPRQLFVGSRKASINPTTGAEEFGLFGDALNKVKGWFSHDSSVDENFTKNLELPPLPQINVAPSWKERWGDTDHKVVAQRAFNDFQDPDNSPEDRVAIEQAARKRFLNDPSAQLDPKQLPNVHDLGMLQDLNPHELNRGVIADGASQKRWRDGKGYESDIHYVGPDNIVRWRSGQISANPHAAGGLLNVFNKRTQYDRSTAGKRTLNDLPSDVINPWDFPAPPGSYR